MSQVNPYGSIAKRTFESALVYVLETDYGLLGGRRILQLLAEDVVKLVEEFYPKTERAESGTLVWTCTADEGHKAQPGKPTEEYKTVTVRLPLVTDEDLVQRTTQPGVRPGRREAGHERDKRRLARLVKAAAAQGGLLTIAELSVILNKSYELVRRYAQEWEEETGELLPLKGYRMDQGSRPTHKGEIIRLYEQGWEPPDIARQTGHNLKSVERYLKDYERTKLLLEQGMSIEQISHAIDRGKRTVVEYIEQARKHHPERFAKAL